MVLLSFDWWKTITAAAIPTAENQPRNSPLLAVAQSPRESAANLRRDAAGIEPKETFHVGAESFLSSPFLSPERRLWSLSWSRLVNYTASFDPEMSS